MKIRDIPRYREIHRKIRNMQKISYEEQRMLNGEFEFWAKAQIYITLPISLISIVLSVISIILK